MNLKLKELRKQAKKKQNDIAIALNMPKWKYYRYETGECQPSINTLMKIADFYSVSLDYLCGRPFNNVVGYLTDEQRKIVNNLKKLDEINLARADAYIHALVDTQKI